MLLTILAKKTLAVLTSPSEKMALVQELQRGIAGVERPLDNIDVECAEATMEADKVKIFGAIRRLLSGGFAELNEKVREQLRKWTFESGLQVLDQMPRSTRGVSPLILDVAHYFKERGLHDDADRLMLEAAGARLGSESLYQGTVNRLIDQLTEQQTRMGAEHEATCKTATAIAELHVSKRDYPAALQCYEQVLAAQGAALGWENEATCETATAIQAKVVV